MHTRTLVLAIPALVAVFLGTKALAADLPEEPTLTRAEPIVRMVLQEANNEPFSGQVAVAGVALDRMRAGQWPSTANGVIYQPWQFTGMRARLGKYTNSQISEARNAVRMAQEGWRPCGNDIFWYYAPKEMKPPGRVPSWASETVKKCEIGGHIFYARS